MKISVNIAQAFSNVDIKAIESDKLVEKIGAQLGAVDEVVDWAAKFKGTVIVKVVSCKDHPNADRLHVCTVDDGGVVKNVDRDENGHVQVVCGAPNVREGLLVAWIPPGATVPTTYGTAEPFVLDKRELRGVISNGMLASAAELGLSDDHDGLLEIDAAGAGRELKPGEPFVNSYGLDDLIIDVENKMFTHRPDCFGALGVAREVAGIFGQAFISPDWYLNKPQFGSAADLPLRASVEVPELAPRLMLVALKNVVIKPSPIWLQSALSRVGIRPINNVVDITNFVMYVTAQPLHAYDYDKVAAVSTNGAEIIVRQPHQGEKINLLNGKQITPKPEAIVIASSNELIGLAGVMGGADTEVDHTTKNIILEVASFDMYSIRRTAMAHGLFTDAVTRFNKGQSVWQNDRVLAYAMDQLAELTGAVQASEVIDIHKDLPVNPTLSVDAKFINDRLGLKLSLTDMQTLLTNVEFEVNVKDDKLVATAPFWRTDIEITEDIVEEIGRLYGFDHLPLVLPARSAEPTLKDSQLELKSNIRHSLKAAGANEVLTYSFVDQALLKKVGQNTKNAFAISNALSPSLEYYRLSLTPSLLDKVHANQKAGYDEFAIFELGKAHNVSQADNGEGVPVEFERLAFVYAASAKTHKPNAGAAYFKAVHYLQYLAKRLNVAFTIAPTKNVMLPFEQTRSADILLADGTNIGVIGEYTANTVQNLKLSAYCGGFELDTAALLQAIKGQSDYVPLPKYPKVQQDVSLRVPNTVTYADLQTVLQSALDAEKPAQTYAQLQPLDIYKSTDLPDVKHVSFRLSIASYDTTLTAETVNKLLDTIAAVANQKCDAQRL